jgi:hypothetical protein
MFRVKTSLATVAWLVSARQAGGPRYETPLGFTYLCRSFHIRHKVFE